MISRKAFLSLENFWTLDSALSLLFRWRVVPVRMIKKGDLMIEGLAFVRSEESAFDPETILVLASALDAAWDRLQKSGSRLTRPAYSRATREIIAKRIMEMAQRGVKDDRTLVDDAVQFLSSNYKDF